MKEVSVKAYAALIGKSEKTVYKMIKKEDIDVFKRDGIYQIRVDRNLLKVIDRTQRALEEAKAVLASIESTVKEEPPAREVPAATPKKTVPRKRRATAKVQKKSLKKPAAKVPLKKRSAKKR